MNWDEAFDILKEFKSRYSNFKDEKLINYVLEDLTVLSTLGHTEPKNIILDRVNPDIRVKFEYKAMSVIKHYLYRNDGSIYYSIENENGEKMNIPNWSTAFDMLEDFRKKNDSVKIDKLIDFVKADFVSSSKLEGQKLPKHIALDYIKKEIEVITDYETSDCIRRYLYDMTNHIKRDIYFVNKKLPEDKPTIVNDEPVHDWFELSYASFLTIPRLVMTSMSGDWQKKMVALLNELDETFDWRPEHGRYWVRLRDDHGKFSPADLSDYRHGSIEHLRKKK